MKALTFYLVFPFIFLISILPFPAMYFLSDVLCFVLRDIFGYRKKVVMHNLRNSFPQKTEKELKVIYRKFYSYLCDIILETIKTLTMDEKSTRKRAVFHNTDWLDKMYEDKKSIIVVMGHYGNWEWAGPGFTLATKHKLFVIYRPLSHPYFEKMMVGMRSKFGTKIIPMNNTLREMVAHKNETTATAFIADQSANPESAFWTQFLNQDTATFTGPEKIAKKFNYPVVFMNIKRPKRGYYEIFPEMLCSNPKEAGENEILIAFNKRLEEEIIAEPHLWLWSHKRWKHKREKTV
jgi:Kdo2-lipid IVA lauroyltransferase/acyltransferase